MMPHHGERDHGNTQGGGRSPPRTPNKRREDTKPFELGIEGTPDIGSADTTAAAAASVPASAAAAAAAAAAAVITIKEAGATTVGVSQAGSPPPFSDSLVCSQCTFNNGPRATKGAPALPEPSACAVCLNPLKGAAEVTDWLPPSPTHKEHCQPSRSRGSPLSTIVLPPSSSGGDSTSLERSSLPLARQCPFCTVLVLDPEVTRCPVCRASLLRPSASGESDVRAQVQPECRACTLRNDPRAMVCRACDTPLFGNGGLHVRSGLERSANGAGRQGGK